MHLTETALINVTDNISKAIDEKSALLPVLLDMSKAFDNLNYNLLSKKFSNFPVQQLPIYPVDIKEYNTNIKSQNCDP